MSRRVLEVLDLDKVTDVTFPEPVRLVFLSPGRGGPRVGEIRKTLAPQGRLRLSGTTLRTFADLDPGPPDTPLIALDTVVRDDAPGLERMLLSALAHVDEIVLGVDGRSDPATLKIAQGYADCVFVFEAADIDMTVEDWAPSATNPRGKIDFAAARNLSRARVRAPWSFVIDSDEYLLTKTDLREAVRGVSPAVGALAPMIVVIQDGMRTFESRDYQRLARTRYRWISAVHNQLICDDSIEPPPLDAEIISDNNLRTRAEQADRDAQRDVSVDDLTEESAKGNLNALFHLAKHRVGTGPITEAVRLVEDFRLRCEPNSVLGWKRQWIALGLAVRYYREENNLQEANRWAVRALLDGPSIASFCLLGDIAEDECDLPRALTWYECACAASDSKNISWPALAEMRWGRLAGIRLALSSPENTKRALELLAEPDVTEAEPDSSASSAATDPTAGT